MLEKQNLKFVEDRDKMKAKVGETSRDPQRGPQRNYHIDGGWPGPYSQLGAHHFQGCGGSLFQRRGADQFQG